MKKFNFTLEKKLTISFLSLLIVFLLIFLIIFITLIKQNNDALTINLLGKQSLYIEKLVKELIELKLTEVNTKLLDTNNIKEDNQEEYKKKLNTIILSIDESLKALRDGGVISSSIKVQRITDKMVFTQLTILIRLWDEYKSIVEYYIQTKDEGLFNSAIQKNERLIDEANKATNLMQQASSFRVSIIRYTLIIGLFIFLMTFIISRTIIRKFIKNLGNFISSFELGSSGDLTKNIDIKTNDETQKLAFFYNDFIEKLVSILKQIKTTVLNNQQTFELLTSKTNFTLKAVDQIIVNSNEAYKNSQQLSENYKNMSDELKNIENLILQINDEIKKHNKISTDVNTITYSLIDNINSLKERTMNSQNEIINLKQMIEDGEKGLEDFNKWMMSISKSVEDVIEMIISVHNTIEKTSILAMNAAIEAAHAKEFGSGFSIVADEVRKLSEEEEENINIIDSNLQNIKIDLTTTSESVEKTIKTISSILKTAAKFSESQNYIYNQIESIADRGNQVIEIVKKLLEFANNLSNLSDIISEHIENINNYLMNVANKVSSNESSISNINNEIEKIKESLDQFINIENNNKNLIEKLNEMISIFKLPDEKLPVNKSL